MSFGAPQLYGSSFQGGRPSGIINGSRSSTGMNVPAAYAGYPTQAPPPAAATVAEMEQGYRGPTSTKNDMLNEFTETSIRHAFLRKVFGLLSICLTISFGLCLLGNVLSPFKEWLLANMWFGAVCAVLMLILSLVIICAPGAAEKTPINYILLFAYAFAVGGVFAGIGASYDLVVLSMAIGTTAAISLSCMLFACQVKYDFTKWYPYVMVAFVCILIMSLIGWFVRVKWFQIMYGIFGTLLFSFLLVLDTQMVVGGKRKMQFSVDQYILATLTLFSDIIQIFLYVLRLFSMTDMD